jgi:hypothetical protein
VAGLREDFSFCFALHLHTAIKTLAHPHHHTHSLLPAEALTTVAILLETPRAQPAGAFKRWPSMMLLGEGKKGVCVFFDVR